MLHVLKQVARHSVSAVLGLAALVWFAGCEESLAPREPFNEELSVYGLLTPDRDTQSVWVFPIEEFPTLGTPDAMNDVMVRSTDLETGEVIVWQDTVVQRANGQFEYLWQAPFRAEFDRRYRVEVQRAGDEAPAWSEVRIPPRVNVDIVHASRDTVAVEVIGDAFEFMRSEIEYHILGRGRTKPDTSYFRQYWGREESIPGGIRLIIRFNIDRFWVEAWYAADFQTGGTGICPHFPAIFLGDLRLHGLIGDAAWAPPGPAFDPYTLSQPGTMQNVENGTGFIGGGYRIDADLDVPEDAVRAACFLYCRSPWFGCDVP